MIMAALILVFFAFAFKDDSRDPKPRETTA
jgi:hypothetical protein